MGNVSHGRPKKSSSKIYNLKNMTNQTFFFDNSTTITSQLIQHYTDIFWDQTYKYPPSRLKE